jgi:hypothetical protein
MESLSPTQPDSETGQHDRDRDQARRDDTWNGVRQRSPRAGLRRLFQRHASDLSVAPGRHRPTWPRRVTHWTIVALTRATLGRRQNGRTRCNCATLPPRPAGGMRDRRVRMRRAHCAGSRHQNDARRVLCGATVACGRAVGGPHRRHDRRCRRSRSGRGSRSRGHHGGGLGWSSRRSRRWRNDGWSHRSRGRRRCGLRTWGGRRRGCRGRVGGNPRRKQGQWIDIRVVAADSNAEINVRQVVLWLAGWTRRGDRLALVDPRATLHEQGAEMRQ